MTSWVQRIDEANPTTRQWIEATRHYTTLALAAAVGETVTSEEILEANVRFNQVLFRGEAA